MATADKYELPMAVAGSCGELAEMLGVTRSAISHALEGSGYRKTIGKQSNRKYIKVEVKGGKRVKHGKAPTVRQKKLIADAGLNYDNWLVERDLPTDMIIIHRLTGSGYKLIKEDGQYVKKVRLDD